MPFLRGFLHFASILLTVRSLAPRKARNPHYLSTSVAKAPYKPPTSHLQACYSGDTPARLRYLMGGPPVPVLRYTPPTSLAGGRFEGGVFSFLRKPRADRIDRKSTRLNSSHL